MASLIPVFTSVIFTLPSLTTKTYFDFGAFSSSSSVPVFDFASAGGTRSTTLWIGTDNALPEVRRDDRDLRGHARPQAVVGIVDLHLHLEVAHARRRALLERGGAADLGDVAGVLLVGNGVDVDLRRLFEADAGDLGLAHFGFDQDLGEVGDDGDDRAGIVHRAGDDHFAFVRVELHDLAVDRREDRGVDRDRSAACCNSRLRLRARPACAES